MGLLGSVEIAEGYLCAIFLDVSLPATGGLMETGAPQPVWIGRAVHALLRTCRRPEIAPAIVERLPVDVVDLGKPLSGHQEPRDLVSVVFSAIEKDDANDLATGFAGSNNATGLPRQLSPMARQEPPKLTALGIVSDMTADLLAGLQRGFDPARHDSGIPRTIPIRTTRPRESHHLTGGNAPFEVIARFEEFEAIFVDDDARTIATDHRFVGAIVTGSVVRHVAVPPHLVPPSIIFLENIGARTRPNLEEIAPLGERRARTCYFGLSHDLLLLSRLRSGAADGSEPFVAPIG